MNKEESYKDYQTKKLGEFGYGKDLFDILNKNFSIGNQDTIIEKFVDKLNAQYFILEDEKKTGYYFKLIDTIKETKYFSILVKFNNINETNFFIKKENFKFFFESIADIYFYNIYKIYHYCIELIKDFGNVFIVYLIKTYIDVLFNNPKNIKDMNYDYYINTYAKYYSYINHLNGISDLSINNSKMYVFNIFLNDIFNNFNIFETYKEIKDFNIYKTKILGKLDDIFEEYKILMFLALNDATDDYISNILSNDDQKKKIFIGSILYGFRILILNNIFLKDFKSFDYNSLKIFPKSLLVIEDKKDVDMEESIKKIENNEKKENGEFIKKMVSEEKKEGENKEIYEKGIRDLEESSKGFEKLNSFYGKKEEYDEKKEGDKKYNKIKTSNEERERYLNGTNYTNYFYGNNYDEHIYKLGGEYKDSIIQDYFDNFLKLSIIGEEYIITIKIDKGVKENIFFLENRQFGFASYTTEGEFNFQINISALKKLFNEIFEMKIHYLFLFYYYNYFINRGFTVYGWIIDNFMNLVLKTTGLIGNGSFKVINLLNIANASCGKDTIFGGNRFVYLRTILESGNEETNPLNENYSLDSIFNFYKKETFGQAASISKILFYLEIYISINNDEHRPIITLNGKKMSVTYKMMLDNYDAIFKTMIVSEKSISGMFKYFIDYERTKSKNSNKNIEEQFITFKRYTLWLLRLTYNYFIIKNRLLLEFAFTYNEIYDIKKAYSGSDFNKIESLFKQDVLQKLDFSPKVYYLSDLESLGGDQGLLNLYRKQDGLIQRDELEVGTSVKPYMALTCYEDTSDLPFLYNIFEFFDKRFAQDETDRKEYKKRCENAFQILCNIHIEYIYNELEDSPKNISNILSSMLYVGMKCDIITKYGYLVNNYEINKKSFFSGKEKDELIGGMNSYKILFYKLMIFLKVIETNDKYDSIRIFFLNYLKKDQRIYDHNIYLSVMAYFPTIIKKKENISDIIEDIDKMYRNETKLKTTDPDNTEKIIKDFELDKLFNTLDFQFNTFDITIFSNYKDDLKNEYYNITILLEDYLKEIEIMDLKSNDTMKNYLKNKIMVFNNQFLTEIFNENEIYSKKEEEPTNYPNDLTEDIDKNKTNFITQEEKEKKKKETEKKEEKKKKKRNRKKRRKKKRNS